ncbi:MAG: VOC family protein [Hyphomonadaceae bacterium]
MTKITPFLWFDANIEDVVAYYASIFPDTRVLSANPMSASFELLGQRFNALNGGPHFKFNEAVSFFIECADQAEVDFYWEKLTADGGAESQCGWLKDRYGLSWQVIPKRLNELFSDPDRAKASRAQQAMLKMKKIIVAELDAAAAG